MLEKDFGYTVKKLLANGRDIYFDGDWLGVLEFNRNGSPRGFIVSNPEGNHLKTMCLLHDQKIIDTQGRT